MFADTHFETLFSERLGKLGRFLHAWEALGRVDVEGIRVDRLAVMNRVTDGLKQTELETVAPFDSDAEVRKDEEALMRAIDIFEMIEAGDARAARISCFAIVEQMELLVGFCMTEHGIHEKVWVLEIPGFVLPTVSKSCADRETASHARRPGNLWAMTGSPFNGWCYVCRFHSVGLTDRTIVGDNTKLNDGRRVNGTSVRLLADTAHS